MRAPSAPRFPFTPSPRGGRARAGYAAGAGPRRRLADRHCL